MAAKKGNSSDRIYDYFKTEPIVLNGRFASYADKMWVQNKIPECVPPEHRCRNPLCPHSQYPQSGPSGLCIPCRKYDCRTYVASFLLFDVHTWFIGNQHFDKRLLRVPYIVNRVSLTDIQYFLYDREVRIRGIASEVFVLHEDTIFQLICKHDREGCKLAGLEVFQCLEPFLVAGSFLYLQIFIVGLEITILHILHAVR